MDYRTDRKRLLRCVAVEKNLYIYDNKRNKKTEKSFSDAGEWSPVCAVSEDEKYFICADSKSGTVYYIDLGTDEKNRCPRGYI